jgi:hypothetical protein
VLRAELTRELGVEWTSIYNGIAEVVGVPPRLIQAFSRWRAEIEASLAERGTVGPRAAEVVAVATRRAKDRSVDPDRLLEEWRERATALGFGRQSLNAIRRRVHAAALGDTDLGGLARELFGADGLTAHASSFDRRDVIEALCDRLPGPASRTTE